MRLMWIARKEWRPKTKFQIVLSPDKIQSLVSKAETPCAAPAMTRSSSAASMATTPNESGALDLDLDSDSEDDPDLAMIVAGGPRPLATSAEASHRQSDLAQ